MVKVLTETEGDKKGKKAGMDDWLASGLQERKTSFILSAVPFEGRTRCHLRNILSSSPNTA